MKTPVTFKYKFSYHMIQLRKAEKIYLTLTKLVMSIV